MCHPRIGALCLTLLPLLAVLPSPLAAGICDRANRPAATLLIPYFEVDLADRDGRSTLISIHNADRQPAVANVVVWTNWGIPTGVGQSWPNSADPRS